MRKIDFNFSLDSNTLFHSCFQELIKAERYQMGDKLQEKVSRMPIQEIIKQTKENLSFLLKAANQYNKNTSKIFEKPNKIGETVFYFAYDLFQDDSQDDSIIQFCETNNIKINYVKLNFDTVSPQPRHALFFIKNGINLKIIGENGRSPLMDLREISQRMSMSCSPKLERLIEILPNSAYFSPVEQNCTKHCPAGVAYKSDFYNCFSMILFLINPMKTTVNLE